MSTVPTLDEVKQELANLDAAVAAPTLFMKEIVRLLHTRMTRYKWVGFYMIEQQLSGEPILVLGPFQGAMTPHTRIPSQSGNLWGRSVHRQNRDSGRCKQRHTLSGLFD